MGHVLKFRFDERKGVEALAHVACKWPGITAFYASKVLYFAEKQHLNRYGRPIVADTFIAMPNGPVPSTLYEFIKGNLDDAGDPGAVVGAIAITRNPYPSISARRDADLSYLSGSDVECLDEALGFCRTKGFGHLSSISHDAAWRAASLNGPMDYAEMVEHDHPAREQLLDDLEEFAAYGVL